MIEKQTNDVWQEKCKELYEDAKKRNDITIAEFHELPMVLDFINYLESGEPVLSSNELSLERDRVIWYDVTTNEFRPLRKHFDELINSIPGMTARRYGDILRDVGLIAGNSDQTELGSEGRKYTYWRVKADQRISKLVEKARLLVESRREGKC